MWPVTKWPPRARANLEGTLEIMSETGARVLANCALPFSLERIDPDQFRGAALARCRPSAQPYGEAFSDFQAVPETFCAHGQFR